MKHREGRGIEEKSPPALEDRVNTGPSTVSNGTESCGEDGTCLHYTAIDFVVPILPSRMLKHGWKVALTFPQKSPSRQADATIFFPSVCMVVGRKHEEEEEELWSDDDDERTDNKADASTVATTLGELARLMVLRLLSSVSSLTWRAGWSSTN